MGTKKRASGMKAILEAIDQVRSFGISDEALESLVRDAEDGLELGLGAVPPAVPAKYALGAKERVELMGALTTLAEGLRARVSECARRNSTKKPAPESAPLRKVG